MRKYHLILSYDLRDSVTDRQKYTKLKKQTPCTKAKIEIAIAREVQIIVICSILD